MNNNRKQIILEKLANRMLYTHLGGRKIADPKKASSIIEAWLKKNPKATVSDLTARFAPSRLPGMGAKVLKS